MYKVFAVASAVLLAVAAATIAAVRAPAASLDSSSLAIDNTIRVQATIVTCPAGTPTLVACYSNTAKPPGRVPGLGDLVPNFDVHVDRSDPAGRCSSWTVVGSFTALGKGAFTVAGSSEGCQPIAEGGPGGRILFRITGGDGQLAGASGSGELAFAVQQLVTPVRLTGTLTVPGHSFDTTPPAITAANKTVRARRGARAARVRYVVTATDNVDGNVPVTCQAKSGSSFKIGRTTVRCSAVDSSANEATARFTIAVKRSTGRRL